MPISFQCPNTDCGRKFTVTSRYAGKRCKCPVCGTAIAIPVKSASKLVSDELKGLALDPERAHPETAVPAKVTNKNAARNKFAKIVHWVLRLFIFVSVTVLLIAIGHWLGMSLHTPWVLYGIFSVYIISQKGWTSLRWWALGTLMGGCLGPISYFLVPFVPETDNSKTKKSYLDWMLSSLVFGFCVYLVYCFVFAIFFVLVTAIIDTRPAPYFTSYAGAFVLCCSGVPLIWIVTGILSAKAFAQKGWHGIGWAAVGICLGPFSYLLMTMVPKTQKQQMKEFVQTGKMKKCPFCAELIQFEAIKCRHCGEMLEKQNP